jgi:sulfoquinovose isomerase
VSEHRRSVEDRGHRQWLDDETRRLLDFGRHVVRDGGGAFSLDDQGAPRLNQPIETWITARMVHVYGLGMLLGRPEAEAIASGCLDGLLGTLADADHGGWHTAVDADGAPITTEKSCYAHAFVLLASSTAVVAGLPRADGLFAQAQEVLLQRFWDEDTGMCVDTWDRTWTDLADYRGINANMHAVEAMLATADVTGDLEWAERAARVAMRTVQWARDHDWRIPEHFDADWRPDLEYNRDRPADPFKPYGATVGHGLEWARLLLQLEATLGEGAPRGLEEAAVRLFERSVNDGWEVDGRPGFVYTTDWDGQPMVCTRMHWVLAEGIATAAAIGRRTGDPAYAAWYATWWDYAERFLIDRHGGSWRHELDPENVPSSQTWQGKPDLYHAVQTTLLPRVPAAPSIASALRAGLLES